MSQSPVSWELLVVEGDEYNRQIIYSRFTKICLGAVDYNSYSEYFFHNEHKPEANKILNSYTASSEINWTWKVQENEDWHLAWKDSFNPIIISSALAIVPDWEDRILAPIQIRIMPGNAFGTGHHETTWLILQNLIKMIHPGIDVLDVGTGSGILAIAAKKLGAGSVTCIEYDEDCRENFEINTGLNSLQNDLSFIPQDATTWGNFNFDLILVNVNRNVILETLPLLSETDGTILLTGILITDIPIVETELTRFHLKTDSIDRRGEWACLTVSKQK